MPGWVAVHSLLLADHPYKRWGEIDFLLVGPAGLLALEVKGGRVACVDGIWEFTDRNGVIHRKSESPMRQASSGLMALRDWLRDQLPHPLVDRVSFGWGVVFPDIEFHQASPEWDPRASVTAAMSAILRGSSDGCATWPATGRSTMTARTSCPPTRSCSCCA